MDLNRSLPLLLLSVAGSLAPVVHGKLSASSQQQHLNNIKNSSSDESSSASSAATAKQGSTTNNSGNRLLHLDGQSGNLRRSTKWHKKQRQEERQLNLFEDLRNSLAARNSDLAFTLSEPEEPAPPLVQTKQDINSSTSSSNNIFAPSPPTASEPVIMTLSNMETLAVLEDVGNNGACDQGYTEPCFPLKICQGDCDNDDECEVS